MIESTTYRTPPPPGDGRRRFRGVAIATLGVLLGLVAPVRGLELRLTTNNDFLTDYPTPDDLYTFSLVLEADVGRATLAFREHAFTDREAGVRFDESHLVVGWTLPSFGRWLARAEIGTVRVGRGLLGEDAQNALHRFLGDEVLELEYVGDGEIHPSLRIAAERPQEVGPALTVGPWIDLFAGPGFGSYAVFGTRGAWQLNPTLRIRGMLGVRLAETSVEALDPHFADASATAELGITYRDRLFVSWTYNRFGTEQEHLSLGYRLGWPDRDRPGFD